MFGVQIFTEHKPGEASVTFSKKGDLKLAINPCILKVLHVIKHKDNLRNATLAYLELKDVPL